MFDLQCVKLHKRVELMCVGVKCAEKCYKCAKSVLSVGGVT